MFRKRIVGNGVNYFTNNIYDHSPAISDDDYIGPHTDDIEVYVPRLTKKETTIDSKTYTTEYLAFDSYSQPISISETGDASRTIARTYWYNPPLNIVNRLAGEAITYGSSVFPTNYSYNSNGTIQSKNVAGVITSYTYHRNNGNLRRVTDASGRWIENTEYQYGIPKTINKGSVYSITRVINWEGTIASETDGRGHTTCFWYDSRNRLIRIIPPIGDPTIIEYSYGGGDRPFSVYKKISFGPAWTNYRFDHWGNIEFSQTSWHNIMIY